jgi:hypothetical protein
MKTEKTNPADGQCIIEQLVAMRERIVKGMQSFGEKDAKLQNAAEWLPRALNLERAHLKWATESNKLISEAQAILTPSSVVIHHTVEEIRNTEIETNRERQEYGGKELAKQFRNAYLKREAGAGRKLQKADLRGPYYTNARGLVMGLTFSSDLKPGKRWWVNWKKEADEVVIFCLVRADAVRVVYIPQPFLQRYGNQLRPGPDGLIQITIREKEKKFYAVVTGIGDIEISEYVGKDLLILNDNDRYEFV